MTPSDAATDITEAPDPAAERASARLRALQAMTRTGLAAAETLQLQMEVQATAPDADPVRAARAAADLARAFAQVARAVSVAVALEDRLDRDAETRRREDEAKAAALARQPRISTAAEFEAECALAWAATPPVERRRELLRVVVPEMIDARGEPAIVFQDCEDLIDREIGDQDILARPIPELIALICRDLEVEPDWSLWTPQDYPADHWALGEADLVVPDPAPEDGLGTPPKPPRSAAWPEPGLLMAELTKVPQLE